LFHDFPVAYRIRPADPRQAETAVQLSHQSFRGRHRKRKANGATRVHLRTKLSFAGTKRAKRNKALQGLDIHQKLQKKEGEIETYTQAGDFTA
jgi:hypothetical protein